MRNYLFLVYIAILLLLLSCTIDNRRNMIPFENENGKWGYADRESQKKLISPSYDLAYPFIDDRAIIGLIDYLSDNQFKYGLIDTLGNYLLQPVYKYIKFPRHGYYVVKDADGIKVLDSLLNEVVHLNYMDITILDQEYALVLNEAKKGLYSLVKQREILPVQYDNIIVYPSTFIKVEKHDKFGYFNQEGKSITAVKYGYPDNDDFNNGYLVVNHNELYGIIDTTGTEIVPVIHKNILDIDTQAQIFVSYIDGKTNVYDFNSQLLFSGIYGSPYPTQHYSEGLMSFSKIGKGFGFIDTKGQLAIPYMYDFIESFGFRDGFATVIRDNQIAVINKENKIVLPFTSDYYYKLLPDSTICIIDVKNNISKLVDNKLNEITPAEYNEIEYLGEGYYKVGLNKLYGMIDKYGNELLPVQYVEIKNLINDIIPIINTSNKFGFYNTRNKMVFPCKYSYSKVDDMYLENGFTPVREDSIIYKGKILLIDRNGQEYVVKHPDRYIFH